MATFSARRAIWSGFHLIRDRPAAVMIWAAAYFVLMLLPYAALLPLVIQDFAAMTADLETTPSEASLAQAFALQAKLSLLQAVQIITAFVAFSMLYGAVFRAVFAPHESRLGYMRFGAPELWLGLVYAVATVILIMLMIVLFIPVLLIGVAGALAAGPGQDPTMATVLTATILTLAAFAVIIWLSARFSLAFPMSFAERKFLLFEAWPMTKGHAGKIVLVFLAVLAIVLVIQLVLFGVMAAVGVAALAILHPDTETFFQRPAAEWIRDLAPWILLGGVVLSVFSAAAYAVFAAPLASIYQQLRGEAATAT